MFIFFGFIFFFFTYKNFLLYTLSFVRSEINLNRNCTTNAGAPPFRFEMINKRFSLLDKFKLKLRSRIGNEQANDRMNERMNGWLVGWFVGCEMIGGLALCSLACCSAALFVGWLVDSMNEANTFSLTLPVSLSGVKLSRLFKRVMKIH